MSDHSWVPAARKAKQETEARKPALGGARGGNLLDVQSKAGNRATVALLEEQQEAAKAKKKAPSKADKAFWKLQGLGFDEFAGWIGKIGGLAKDTGTGSTEVEAGFEVGVGTGIPDLLDATVTAGIGLGARMYMGDGRDFEVSGKISFSINSELVLAFWTTNASIGTSLSIGGRYQDERHFAAHVLKAVGKLLGGYQEALFGVMKSKGSKNKQAAKDIATLPEQLPQGYQEYAKTPVLSQVLRWSVDAEVTSKLDWGAGNVEGGLAASKEKAAFFKRDKDGNLLVKKGSTDSFSGYLSVDLGFVKLRVDVGWSEVKGEANPDNDGEYLTISIAPELPIPIINDVSVSALIALFMLDFTSFSPRNWKSLVGDAVTGALGATGKPTEIFDKLGSEGPAFDTTTAVDICLMNTADEKERKKDWRVLYGRIKNVRAVEFDHTVKTATPIPGLNVAFGVNFSFSQESGLKEILGYDSLAYFRQVYNGFMTRGPRGKGQWRSWCKDQPDAINSFIANISPAGDKPGKANRVRQEVDQFLGEGKSFETYTRLKSAAPDKDQPAMASAWDRARNLAKAADAAFAGYGRELQEIDAKLEHLDRDAATAQRVRMVTAAVKRRAAPVAPIFDDYLEVRRLVDYAIDEQDNWQRFSPAKIRATARFGPSGVGLRMDQFRPRNPKDAKPEQLRAACMGGQETTLLLVVAGRPKPIEVEFRSVDDAQKKIVKKLQAEWPHAGVLPSDIGALKPFQQLVRKYGVVSSWMTAGATGKELKKADKQLDTAWKGDSLKPFEALVDLILDAHLAGS
ncbi:MAG: hypothetical protein ACRD0G_13600 [Acidimicrobiales bacterium]